MTETVTRTVTRTDPTSPASPAQAALRAIQEFTDAENPSSFLAVNEGNAYFTLPGRPGVVVYRPTSRNLVQLGGPFAPAESYRELLTAFVDFAGRQGKTVVAVQVQAADAAVYSEHGFTVNQIGSSYAVDLAGFTLAGTRFMQLRNKISRALRNGLTVIEADLDDWHDEMRALDRVWLPSKGENARQLEYLVGQYGGPMQEHRRLFVGLVEGRLAGYISYSPVYGSRPGWMHDLSRRLPGNSPGIMEAINKAAIDVLQSEGVRWLHFGFTPFTTLRDDLELPGASTAFTWFMHFLWEHGAAVYPAATQLAYKEKWAQSVILPEYVAFQGPASIADFVHIFRAAGAL
ncbi:DUF2156 domain-containing protein [Frankia sp. Cpl3]|nr:DUF2156 domain-containing protein [Frankia sp. Cpl3]